MKKREKAKAQETEKNKKKSLWFCCGHVMRLSTLTGHLSFRRVPWRFVSIFAASFSHWSSQLKKTFSFRALSFVFLHTKTHKAQGNSNEGRKRGQRGTQKTLKDFLTLTSNITNTPSSVVLFLFLSSKDSQQNNQKQMVKQKFSNDRGSCFDLPLFLSFFPSNHTERIPSIC